MFDPKFDEVRQMLKFIQESSEPLAIQLNALNPQEGGPGIDATAAHMFVGSLVATTHNLAMALGQVVDYLDEHPPATT